MLISAVLWYSVDNPLRKGTLSDIWLQLLAPNIDIFTDVAANQPAFRDFLDHMYNKEVVRSPDGSTKHLVYKYAPYMNEHLAVPLIKGARLR